MLRLTLFSLLLILFFAFPARAETTNHQNEIMCLADNIYHEAGNQSLTGKIAVTNVVMNRMKQPERFASTACGVIYQRHQFSWVPHRRKSRNSELFRECVEIATRVYYGTYRDVTNVVMNRMKQPERFASTACGVIYQRHQFSWVPHRRKSKNSELFRECVEIATRVYYGTYRDVTNGALFYHANYVNPRWRYRPVARIGAHIFYRG